MKDIKQIGVTSNNTTTFWSHTEGKQIDDQIYYLVGDLGEATPDNMSVIVDTSNYLENLFKTHNIRVAYYKDDTLHIATIIEMVRAGLLVNFRAIDYNDDTYKPDIIGFGVDSLAKYDSDASLYEAGLFIMVPVPSI